MPLSTRDFLNVLYGKCGSGCLTLMGLNPNRIQHVPVSDLELAASLIETQGKRQDFYYSIALRREGLSSSRRGGIDDIHAAVCLATDIDVKGPAHAEDKLPETFEEARDFILSLPQRPTIVVNSGNGLHAIWLLKEPVVFDDPVLEETVSSKTDAASAATAEGIAKKDAFKRIAEGFGLYIVSEGAKRGWKLDMVGDLPRMLRAPGSMNHKLDPAVPCLVESWDGPKYSPSDFASYAVPDKAFSPVNLPSDAMGSADRMKGRCAFIDHCIDDAAALTEPEWHAMLSIVSQASDGCGKCHEWSSPYPGYDESETEAHCRRSLKENKPCSCRFIGSRFPGYCPVNGCGVKAPVVFCILSKSERIDNLTASKPDLETMLDDPSLSLAAYAKEHDTARYIRMKDAAAKAGIGKREYEKAVKEALQAKREAASASSASADFDVIPDDLELNGIDTGELVTPPGYRVGMDGVFILKYDPDYNMTAEDRLCNFPVIITERLENVDDMSEHLQIAFLHNGHWKRETVPRSTLMNKAQLIHLSDKGLSITSETSGQLTSYFNAFEAVNQEALPLVRSIDRVGWKGNEFFPYYTRDSVKYLDEDPSRVNMMKALHTDGEYEAWKELGAKMRATPVARAMLAASFAAPLVEKLKKRTIILHVWHGSLSGKTAALKGAISVWGDPSELIGTFDATQVGLERRASTMRNLPVGIDELQALNQKRLPVSSIIYMLGNGKGRTRGNKTGGMQRIESWRTSVITTGEQPMQTESTMDGAGNRLMEIYGAPFRTPEECSYAHEASETNYGFAGQEFIRFLAEDVIRTGVGGSNADGADGADGADRADRADGVHKPDSAPSDGSVSGDGDHKVSGDRAANDGIGSGDKDNRYSGRDSGRDRLRRDYDAMRMSIVDACKKQKADPGPHIENMTLIALADYYSSISVFGIDKEQSWIEAVELATAISENFGSFKRDDTVDSAWVHLCQWVMANKQHFIGGRSGMYSTMPPQDPVYGQIEGGKVYVTTSYANDELDRHGFPHVKCAQGFKERDYIGSWPDANGKIRTQKVKCINGIRVRVYELNLDIQKDEDPAPEFGVLEDDAPAFCD